MEDGLIVDSALTLEEALAGKEIPEDIRETLALLDIVYISFDGKRHQGQLVVHRTLAEEVRDIFGTLCGIGFPIAKMIPVVRYNWSDDASMADNNTSSFNYRVIYGTDRLSNHSYGLAVDINPALNPYFAADGKVFPAGAQYRPEIAGTLKAGGEAVELFVSRGWEWGGTWQRKDWQHFQKTP